MASDEAVSRCVGIASSPSLVEFLAMTNMKSLIELLAMTEGWARFSARSRYEGGYGVRLAAPLRRGS